MSNIVYSGISSKGREFTIRYIEADDVPELHRFINEISAERTFISFQGEEISLDEEEKFVTSQLKNIVNHKSVHLVVELNQQIIGNADVNLKIRAENHIGVLGLIMHQEYRGEGIGKKLLETVITEATKQIKGLKIIELGVLSNNPLAHNLYQKMGFKEFGRLPQGYRHRETFVEHIYMYKQVS